jgi:hypothetical protein
MEFGADLVRHAVAHAEEGVGEGDAGDGRGVVHHLPRLRVPGAVGIGGRQVGTEQLERLQRLGIGILVRHHRHVGLQRVGHRVDAAIGGQAAGHVHHQVRIDDGHARRELVVGDRVLDAGLLVGDHGERL